ncbi:uncharacterized protein L3040_009593 [Drepanopeziza brunnea f. sp. 'multigermtubi']|uniref:uncharacterized protein n=1 Tax=Drepanopeziza brunnea f. sp. 'multigermtubi' TaxID=698441 RepID=UPI0023A604F5|nr:hypothetical protein L3040_009593 [Drepanopeziza brunnea f. sp. 'multigermtubi']
MYDEKAPSTKGKAERFFRNGKFASCLTLLAALVAFCLSLVAILSTGDNKQLRQYSLLTLNTSRLFQDVVKIRSTNTARSPDLMALSSPDASETVDPPVSPQVTPRAVLPDRVEARQLPPPSDLFSWLESVGSDLPQPTGIPRPGGDPDTDPDPDGDGGSVVQELQGLFNNLLGAASGAVGEEIIQVVNRLVAEVLDALGIKDYYSLYLDEFCSGDYTESGGMDTDKCTSFDNALTLPGSSSSSSTLQIGSTIFDFSALNLPAKLSSAGGTITQLTRALLALLALGTASSGLLILLTPLLTILLSLFLHPKRQPAVRLLLTALAALASTSLLTVAAIETAILVLVSGLVNGVGDGLGIEVQSGRRYLALLWVSAGAMLLATAVWLWTWHVEYYVRRPRPEGFSDDGDDDDRHLSSSSSSASAASGGGSEWEAERGRPAFRSRLDPGSVLHPRGPEAGVAYS